MKKTICDRCGKQAYLRYGLTLISLTFTKYSLETHSDLCINCATEFTNWLKGEPIPKQTTFPKFNTSTSKRKTKP